MENLTTLLETPMIPLNLPPLSWWFWHDGVALVLQVYNTTWILDAHSYQGAANIVCSTKHLVSFQYSFLNLNQLEDNTLSPTEVCLSSWNFWKSKLFLWKCYCTCTCWSPKHAISEFVYTLYTALYRDLGLKGKFYVYLIYM